MPQGGILLLIVANVIIFTVQTVEGVGYETFFSVFEVVSVGIFTVEYLLKLWSCSVDPAFGYVAVALEAVGRRSVPAAPVSWHFMPENRARPATEGHVKCCSTIGGAKGGRAEWKEKGVWTWGNGSVSRERHQNLCHVRTSQHYNSRQGLCFGSYCVGDPPAKQNWVRYVIPDGTRKPLEGEGHVGTKRERSPAQDPPESKRPKETSAPNGRATNPPSTSGCGGGGGG